MLLCLTHSLSFSSLSLSVQGYKQRRAYIATQGPLSETVVDMWRMIWENDCCCIIMLCRTVENDQVGLSTINIFLFSLLLFSVIAVHLSTTAKNMWLHVCLSLNFYNICPLFLASRKAVIVSGLREQEKKWCMVK